MSDEHILPLALGGNVVLPNSSCEVCRRITHKFEEDVLGDTGMRVFRAQVGLPTRRPKHRPNVGDIDVNGAELSVPLDDLPIYIYSLVMPRAGILDGRPVSNTIDDIRVQLSANQSNLIENLKKYPGKKLSSSEK